MLVAWGTFHRDLAARDGLPLPFPTIDLRPLVTRLLQRRQRSIQDCLPDLAAPPTALDLPGRAGRRLASLVSAVIALTRDP